jgi:DNA-binding SARP family transcriptional activator/tetratricopeptide (TPR) repeat protein
VPYLAASARLGDNRYKSTPEAGVKLADAAGAALRERIARPELTGRIRDALVRGSLLLVADAGFGKTLAVEEALTDWRTSAWVGCTDADRDAGRLVMNVLGALRQALPGAVDALEQRLTIGAGTVDPLLVAHTLTAELGLLLVEPVVVVLDDAEQLAESKDAAAVIARMLASDSKLRLAVASRRELPLRTAKLRMSGAVTVMRSADVAFTTDECAQFLSMRMGRLPTPDGVARAMEATEGWPLALELGAAAGEQFGGGLGSRRVTFEYLAEEVLTAVEPDLRERALDSSVASELTPDVIDSLGLPADFVAEAQRNGLFLRLRDPARDAYAFHPLFREFLLTELYRTRSESDLRRLRALAARGLVASGRLADSVDHWLAAGEWAGAIGAIAGASQQLLRTSPGTLLAWLERLPGDARRDPACLLIYGQLAWSAGRDEHAVPLLREAVAANRRAGNVEGEWMARWVLSDALFQSGEFEEMNDVAEGWDRFEPGAAPLGAFGAGFFRAVGLSIAGHSAAANAVCERLTRTAAGAVFKPAVKVGVNAIADAASGRIDVLLRDVKTSIAEFELSDPAGMLPYAVATLAERLADIGEYEAALQALARAREESMRYGLAWVARNTGFLEAILLARQGRAADAELALERAGPAEGTGWRDHSLYVAQAAIAALGNEAPEALTAAEHALDLAARSPPIYRVWATVDLAPVMGAIGAGRRALDLVDETLAMWDSRFPGRRGAYQRARLLAARADLHEHARDRGAAEADVRACFAEAGESARHVLRAAWPRLEPIVWRVLEQGLLEPATVVREVEAGLPGGAALVAMTRHPSPAVRRAAIGAAAASGHPDAIATVERMAREDDPGDAAAAATALERLAREPPRLAFTLLGGFSVMRGRWRADGAAWDRRVAQRLVRFLLLHGGAPVAEDEILAAFWPDRDADSGRRSLRVAASRARHVLDVPGAASVIELAERTYAVRLRAGDRVDASEFEAAATAALREEGDARTRLLERAASVWGGDPLPEERYSDWALGWRERLINLYAAVLAAISDDCLDHGDLIGAGLRARDLVELDPLNEGGHRRLMVVHARAGQRSQALRQFLACRRTLIEQLGVKPARETARLQQRILAGEPV